MAPARGALLSSTFLSCTFTLLEVGVHVEAEDLQGEQTIVVTKMNHHKRALTIQKRDAETGDLISAHTKGCLTLLTSELRMNPSGGVISSAR